MPHTNEPSPAIRVSVFEMLLIEKIAARAQAVVDRSPLHLLMDITYAHQSCPLRLDDLLRADAETFAHDVCGIIQNMDRTSYRLAGCFLPRTAVSP